jgi:hypothetical protein
MGTGACSGGMLEAEAGISIRTARVRWEGQWIILGLMIQMAGLYVWDWHWLEAGENRLEASQTILTLRVRHSPAT